MPLLLDALLPERLLVAGDDGVLDLYTYNMDIFNILFPESDFRRSSEVRGQSSLALDSAGGLRWCSETHLCKGLSLLVPALQ